MKVIAPNGAWRDNLAFLWAGPRWVRVLWRDAGQEQQQIFEAAALAES